MTTVDSSSAALLVRLGDRRFGLPLAAVERVLPMARVLPVPETDEGLLGMLNLHGNVLPVIDIHARLGVARPGITADHRLILLKSVRPFLLWVDEVDEVVALGADAYSGVPARQDSAVVTTVVRLGDEIVPLLAAGALEPRQVAA